MDLEVSLKAISIPSRANASFDISTFTLILEETIFFFDSWQAVATQARRRVLFDQNRIKSLLYVLDVLQPETARL